MGKGVSLLDTFIKTHFILLCALYSFENAILKKLLLLYGNNKLWKLKYRKSLILWHQHKTDDQLDAVPFMLKFLHLSEVIFTF